MAAALFVLSMMWPLSAGGVAPVAHGPGEWLEMLAQPGPATLRPTSLPPIALLADAGQASQELTLQGPSNVSLAEVFSKEAAGQAPQGQIGQGPSNVGLAAAPSKVASSALPNIVFILSDDLGYGDYSISPGVDRSKGQIPTPNIQRMADAGVKFTRGYSGPVCAPSRCTLMTGRHMGRCTIRGNDGSYTPLVDSDVTVAEVLQATHVTAVVGKWGLGDFGTSGYPSAQGFDHFVGQDSQLACHDWFPEYVNNNTEQFQRLNHQEFLGPGCIEDRHGGHCTWANDLVRDESVAFIRQNANGERPFFLYVSSTTPHDAILSNHPDDNYPVPYQYLAAEFIDQSWPSALQKFAAAVWAQDLIVGAVLDELAAQGIEENTIVFFSGDNGPDMHDFSIFQDVGPFRGKKRSLHEGGTRQTIAVQWKGRIAPGTESDQLFAFWDLLPTVAELAGLPRSEWPMTDGVSLAPLLTGEGSQENHDYLYWEFCFYEPADGLMPQSYPPGWIQSLRLDEGGTEWKGIRVDRESMMLWNLTADPGESVDVAASWPEVVERMVLMMEEAHVENQHWPSVGDDGAGPRCCDACYNQQGDNCEVQCIPTQPRMSFWKSDAAKMMKKSEGRKVQASALNGVWTAPDGYTYTLEMSGNFVKVWNMDDPHACWQVGDGVFDVDANRISATVHSSEAFEESSHQSCTHHLIGSVKTTSEEAHLDHDYAYQNISYHIHWQTREGQNGSMTWSRNAGLETRAAKPPNHPRKRGPALADVPSDVITVADVLFAGDEKAAPGEHTSVHDPTQISTPRAVHNHAKRLRAQPRDQGKPTVEGIFTGQAGGVHTEALAQDPVQPIPQEVFSGQIDGAKGEVEAQGQAKLTVEDVFAGRTNEEASRVLDQDPPQAFAKDAFMARTKGEKVEAGAQGQGMPSVEDVFEVAHQKKRAPQGHEQSGAVAKTFLTGRAEQEGGEVEADVQRKLTVEDIFAGAHQENLEVLTDASMGQAHRAEGGSNIQDQPKLANEDALVGQSGDELQLPDQPPATVDQVFQAQIPGGISKAKPHEVLVRQSGHELQLPEQAPATIDQVLSGVDHAFHGQIPGAIRKSELEESLVGHGGDELQLPDQAPATVDQAFNVQIPGDVSIAKLVRQSGDELQLQEQAPATIDQELSGVVDQAFNGQIPGVIRKAELEESVVDQGGDELQQPDQAPATVDQVFNGHLPGAMRKAKPKAMSRPAQPTVKHMFVGHTDERTNKVQVKRQAQATIAETSASQVEEVMNEVRVPEQPGQSVADVFADLSMKQTGADIHKVEGSSTSIHRTTSAARSEHSRGNQTGSDVLHSSPQPARVANTGPPMKFEDMIQLAMVRKA